MIYKDYISKTLKNLKLNWEKWGTIINFLMLLMVIIQVFNIQIPMPSFEKKQYQIYNTDPEIFPSDLYLLNTNPSYYVEMKVNTIDEISYKDDVKFSIDIINKGKKNIENPGYRILICDSLGRIRGIYPKISTPIHSPDDLVLTRDEINLKESDELNFVFKLPSEDQKVTGDWRICTYLFDKNSNSLISYNIHYFKVTDRNYFLSNWIWMTSGIGVFLILMFSSIIEKFIKRK
ncbi:MAG: hypothetical protein PHW22_01200 [Bacilli bacterium]|nr:hypothetical protein [Bacilli bacterium]